MILKDKIKEVPGFQYVFEHLDIISSAARKQLLEQPLMKDADQINLEFNHIATIKELLLNSTHATPLTTLRHQMMQLHDIASTIRNLYHHVILDEVELFEIKQLAHLTEKARQAAEAMDINNMLQLPPMEDIFHLLDPDSTGIPNFYLYDSYDHRLAPIRKELKTLQISADSPNGTTDNTVGQRIAELFAEQDSIQREVLHQLSDQLAPHAARIHQGLTQMAYADILLAKAQQAIDWQLCRPILDEKKTHYQQLFNPRLLHRNQQLGLRYQPVDIEAQAGVCLITGANMAGKTVLLKTLAVAQLMAQFGMFVPAKEATLRLVDDVVICIGDEQNEMNGLSSYASEIIKISQTLSRSAQERLLILIDEPARTTNPIEGRAIVQSIGEILGARDSSTLITTHYSQLGLPCRRLRVRGFDERLSQLPLNADTINQFMDYSLLEEQQEQVPQEALRIAAILGCDEEMIARAQKHLR